MIKKAAVIGLGNISKRHRRNIRLQFPAAKVIAMSASGRKINDSIEDSDYFLSNIEELITEKPGFVIVASPAPLHAAHCISLLQANIPVLVEKPLATNVSDVCAIMDAAANSGTPISVDYCLRYLPSAKLIKQYITEGLIGPIYNASASVGQYLPQWRPTKNFRQTVSAKSSLGGGALLELSHELDYMQWLLGDLALDHAILRNSNELNLEVEEIADLVLTTKTGTVCNIHLDFLQKRPQRKCSFIGEKGRLDWDLLENTITLHSANDDKKLYGEPEWDKNQMYLTMLNDFIALITGTPEQCIDLRQAKETIVLIEEIRKKAVWGTKQ